MTFVPHNLALVALLVPAYATAFQQEKLEDSIPSLRGGNDVRSVSTATERHLQASHCGCNTCTDAVWTTFAGAYRCGDRINYMASPWGGNLPPENACRYVSEEYPSVCGPACHPDLCNAAPPPPPAPAPAKCGCESCTDAVWNHAAGGSHTCGARIEWMQTADGGSLSAADACRFVSNEFPNNECGPYCHPDSCNVTLDPTANPSASPTNRPTAVPTISPTDSPTSSPTGKPSESPVTSPPTPSPETSSPTALPDPDHCSCHACSDAVWTAYAGAYTCGDRMNYMASQWGGNLSPEDACRFVSDEYPSICGPACHPDLCDATAPPTPTPVAPSPKCGCESCTDAVWNHAAGGSHTCGARIEWMQTADGGGMSVDNACRYVSEEFADGECGPMCHPDLCDGGCPLYPDPYVAPADLPPNPPLQATDGLYCFPEYSARKRYAGAFGGGYTIEAKDGQGGVCGPGDNAFVPQTVSYDTAAQELTMEYKKVGSTWAGSEVRVLLPESEGLTFGYGTFTFSVKSVSVLDASDNLISSALPSDLVLGLFTWDITDDYSVNANWNHEVDVEISQWGNPSNAQDVQFLTQPHHPGGPHFPARLSSGGPGTTAADFDQGGHTYGFTWEPNQISWRTSAGGEQSRTYSTQIAKDACAPDYIQCLPANVEIRINLWNMGGGDLAPDVVGLTDGTAVKVVIDDFYFTPSAFENVSDGDVCSKHCQCAAESICGENGTCSPS